MENSKEKRLYLSGSRTVTTALPAFIAGILNINSDSFCPVGKCSIEKGIESAADMAAEKALKLVEEGADILDVGAESTRPGSSYISEEEELRRLIPAIKAIRKVTGCPLSVDTRKAAVMKAAIDEGADMLNDISALEDDAEMAGLCSRAEIPLILMHKREITDIMKHDEECITDIVTSYLAERTAYALSEGIAPEKIILDAGIGFGKDYAENLMLIKASRQIHHGVLSATGFTDDSLFPVMMALSRKRCIGAMTGREVEGRLTGSVSANMVAVVHGATLLRVHDVAETRDMLKVLAALE